MKRATLGELKSTKVRSIHHPSLSRRRTRSFIVGLSKTEFQTPTLSIPVSSVARDESNRGIFLQVVLKGLGSVSGNEVHSLLDEGIPGYREREDNAF